jgi:predicted AlkP superfamily phosphohydrolase/phosphomutase
VGVRARDVDQRARVVAIGLDALDWPLMMSMASRGEMPNLARMYESGANARLRSDAVCRTSLVWDSFLTGDPEPDDRFAGGMAFDPRTYATYKVGTSDRRAFVDDIDGPVVALDVPYLAPTGRIAGAAVCIWGGHVGWYPRASSPPELLAEIDAQVGTDPAVGADEHAWHSRPRLEQLTAALRAATERRVSITRWLAERSPGWRLLVTVLHEAHTVGECASYALDGGHPLAGTEAAPAARDALLDVYRSLDDAVGNLARAFPDAVVVVFSLHGLQPGAPDLASTVLMPELLHRGQLGRARLRGPDPTSWARAGYPPVLPADTESWSHHMRAQWTPRRSPVRALRRRLAHLALGQRARRPRRRAEPGPSGEIRWPIEQPTVCWYRDAWPSMRAFALPSFADGRVRINLEGREANGQVPADDYARACNEVEAWLRACRNPRSRGPAVADLARPRAGDPMDPDGPDADLVVRWSPWVDALEHPDIGVVGPAPFLRTAEHTPHGFVCVTGPGSEARDLGERSIAGLAELLTGLLDGVAPDSFAEATTPGA